MQIKNDIIIIMSNVNKKLNLLAEEVLDFMDFGKYRAIRTTKIEVDSSFANDPNDIVSHIGAVGTVNIVLNYEDKDIKETIDTIATVKFNKQLKLHDAYCRRRSTGHIMFVVDIEAFEAKKAAEKLENELGNKGIVMPKKIKL